MMLRRQLFKTLEDAETSFKLLLENPEMIKMTPEQLQQRLTQPTNQPEQKKERNAKEIIITER